MRIAVWKTGHPIADKVADSLVKISKDAQLFHINAEYEIDGNAKESIADILIKNTDLSIGYGILRGTSNLFKSAEKYNKPWFNVDRGYFNPSHFDGTYRISYRGTQFKWHEGIPGKPIDIQIEPWRTGGDYVLICPPTKAVRRFFCIDSWVAPGIVNGEYIWREKDCSVPIEEHLSKAKAVITFNSSVGWKALQMGIPVLSDTTHSAVGSYFNNLSLDAIAEAQYLDRKKLFQAMAAHQFTLSEIEQGKAWPLLRHYLSMYSSDMMTGKPSPQMSPPIASSSAANQTLKSTFSSIGN